MAGDDVTTNAFDFPDAQRAKQFASDDRLDDYDAYIEASKGQPALNQAIAPDRIDTVARKPRVACSLTHLGAQLDQAFPDRDKSSDGTYGDAQHCPNPDGSGQSDHCPNIIDGDRRVVTAMDVTHDPENYCDAERVVESIRADRDRRVKYIIWNKRICNSSKIDAADAWVWRPYSGVNPHTRHAHISVLRTKAAYDDLSDWQIGPSPQDL